MASVASATTFGEGRVHVWTPLTAVNADGIPVSDIGSGDRCFEVHGTFDGATIILEGSLDKANWYGLKDPAGNAISFTSAGLRQVLENPPHLRPRISVAGTAPSLTASLFIRRGDRNG